MSRPTTLHPPALTTEELTRSISGMSPRIMKRAIANYHNNTEFHPLVRSLLPEQDTASQPLLKGKLNRTPSGLTIANEDFSVAIGTLSDALAPNATRVLELFLGEAATYLPGSAKTQDMKIGQKTFAAIIKNLYQGLPGVAASQQPLTGAQPLNPESYNELNKTHPKTSALLGLVNSEVVTLNNKNFLRVGEQKYSADSIERNLHARAITQEESGMSI